MRGRCARRAPLLLSEHDGLPPVEAPRGVKEIANFSIYGCCQSQQQRCAESRYCAYITHAGFHTKPRANAEGLLANARRARRAKDTCTARVRAVENVLFYYRRANVERAAELT